jgi:hypothetical protein
MGDGPGRTAIRLLAGLTATAVWSAAPTNDLRLVPFLVTGALACVAGWQRDPATAWLLYLGGILGATAGAWAAGPVGVLPGEDPVMRSSYHMMLVVIAAGIAAILGGLEILAGYWLGRRIT